MYGAIHRNAIFISCSCYKSHNTAKSLIGIAPNGFVSFISDLYGGHISDKKITESCSTLDLLEPGDMVMADRGFDIQHILAAKKVKLNIYSLYERERAIIP